MPSIAELQPVIDSYHAPLGAKVAELWKLPESIADAILHHHNPERSRDSSRMALVTAIADLALAHVGLGTQQQTIVPDEHPAFSMLGLGSGQAQAILQYTELLVEDPAAWAMPAV
jgi:HD-like signal output (HDOD) protein